MTHAEILAALMRRYGVGSESRLLDVLQNRGLVSNNCVTMAEVADRDLLRAIDYFHVF